jgi:hypothetical protein
VRDHPGLAEQQQDRLLEPLVDHDLPVDHLGDPGLAPVEQIDRLVDGGDGLGVVRGDLVAALPQVVDAGTQVGHGRRPYRAPAR